MAALREVFARFRTDFNTSQLSRGEAQIERVTASMGRLGLAIGAGLAVRALSTMVDGIRELGDDLDKTSIAMGVSTRALQEWRFAAAIAGVSAGQMDSSMVKLQRSLANARDGSLDAVRAFEAIGVQATDSNGDLKDLEDILPEIADGVAAMGNDSEKSAALMRIFGRAGARLVPLFNDGAEGLAAQREEFERLGGGLSQDAIDASVELTDAYAKFDLALTSLKTTLGLFVLPLIQRFTDTMTDLLASEAKMRAFASTLTVVAGAITLHLAPAIAVLLMKSAALLVAWGPLIVAGGLLYLILEDIFTAMEGGDSITGDLIEALRDGAVMLEGYVLDQFGAFKRLMVDLDNAMSSFFETNRTGNGVLGTITRTWERLINAATRLMALVGGLPSEEPPAAHRGLGPPGQGITARGSASAARGASAAPGRGSLTQTNTTNVNGAGDPVAVAREVERVTRRNNRRAVEALEGRTA